MKTKIIKLDKIIIADTFLNTAPSEKKVNAVRNYYKQHGEFDKPIVLSKNNILLDGYIRYIVAKENGLQEIEYATVMPKEQEQQTNNQNRTITLIKGKFPDNDKEYIWRLPFNKDVNVEIGDTAIVNVKVRGKKSRSAVKVVDVFQSNDYNMIKHRLVVKVIKKEG